MSICVTFVWNVVVCIQETKREGAKPLGYDIKSDSGICGSKVVYMMKTEVL
jgi:hypothetical protein